MNITAGDRVRVKGTFPITHLQGTLGTVRFYAGFDGICSVELDKGGMAQIHEMYLELLMTAGGVTTARREVPAPRERGAGLKYDDGKQQARLIYEGFPRALSLLADVATMGAKKYKAHSWQHVENGIDRYSDAAFRHMQQRLSGEELDSESGLLHEAHELWNRMAVLELKLRKAAE